MMYKCYYCSVTRSTVREFITHYTKYCQLSEYRFHKHFYCGNCDEISSKTYYTNSNSFRKHLYRDHTPKSLSDSDSILHLNILNVPSPSDMSSAKNVPSDILPDVPSDTSLAEGQNENSSYTSISTSDTSNLNLNVVRDALRTEISMVLLDLYSNPSLPRSCVQTCFKGLKNTMVAYNKLLIDATRQLALDDQSRSQVENALMGISTASEATFSNLESEYKRVQYFTKSGSYIPPQEVVIGNRMDYKFGNHTDFVSVMCTMQVIPLNLVLRSFFSLRNILKDTLDYTKSLEAEEERIENIMQGSVWKKMKENFDPNVLNYPLILYMDEFETGNVLGAHASIHKLCGVYISVPCLPRKYFSQLKSIFVLSIFHAADRIKFGNNVIFNPIINMLNLLSSEGITVHVPNVYQGKIRFHTVCMTGDNLSLHGALGFVECFSARYCCRICSIEKQDLQVTWQEKPELLRDAESYQRDLHINDITKTGIKEECVWRDLKGFDLFENVAVDLMHDLLEGVGRYVVEFVLSFFVHLDIVSLSAIQNGIQSFNFGPDSSSRPVNAISGTKSSGIKIKSSASEMTNIIRYLGLIVGPYIPEDHEVWELFLLLRQLLDRLLVQNEVILNRTDFQVSHLVSNLCREYRRLTNSSLKPKFHYLLHYARMMKKFGPLCSYWTMRFEGKHRPLKISARITCNKLNICKTLADRAQLTFCHILNSEESFNFFKCGKLSSLDLTTDELHHLEDSHCYASCKWFKLDGLSVKLLDVFTEDLSIETEDPKFVKVQKILIHKETKDIHLLCRALETLQFDSHYYAYQFKETENTVFKRYLDLYSIIPNTLTVMLNSTLFVSLRSTID